ncbi:hypothetical protein SNEBB_006500 [Seison nebaliae]|nr:hypothetical protein SNEBB_006500 [Seison nebaliae]
MEATVDICVDEKDIVKVILEYLHNRQLYISALNLEKETGLINGDYSEDIIFLRQLIFDGCWEDVMEFIEPLKEVQTFDYSLFVFTILKFQFYEYLCVRNESVSSETDHIEIADFLKHQLKPYCPSIDEYKRLCLLLTIDNLSDDENFKNWSPSSNRVKCFKEIYPMIRLLLDKNDMETKRQSANDRLLQLLAKGMLFEKCVDLCATRAQSINLNNNNTMGYQLTKSHNNNQIICNNFLPLNSLDTQLSNSDAFLLSWLFAIPANVLSKTPFEERRLNMKYKRHQLPSYDAIWSGQLVPSINNIQVHWKPHVFPYNATPTIKYDEFIDTTSSLLLPDRNINDSNRNPAAGALSRSLMIGMMEKSLHSSLNDRNRYGKNVTTSQIYTNEPKTNMSIEQKQNEIFCVDESTADIQISDQQQQQQQIIESISLASSMMSISATTDAVAMPIEEKRPDREYLHEKFTSYFSSVNQSLRKQHDENNVKKSDNQWSDNKPPLFHHLYHCKDMQAIRCAKFHPSGKYYAIGSNSKLLRICQLNEDDFNQVDSDDSLNCQVIYTKDSYHDGSLYTMAWCSPAISDGYVLATGSNDKLIKIIRFNDKNSSIDINNHITNQFAFHEGTIRDICFIPKSYSLLSVGGDRIINLIDIQSQKKVKIFRGHSDMILSVHSWDGTHFATASQDGNVRLWDTRLPESTSIIRNQLSISKEKKVIAATNVRVAPLQPNRIVTGYGDGRITIFDDRSQRVVNDMNNIHTNDIKSFDFLSSSTSISSRKIPENFLLSASYDYRIMLTDLSSINETFHSYQIAEHSDKALCVEWHPFHSMFISSSADRSSYIWKLQKES